MQRDRRTRDARRPITRHALAVAVVARTTCFSALGVTSQLYLSELGASRFWIGMSTTLAWAAIMLFSRFWGTLSDTLFKRKDVILLAATGSTAFTLVLAVSRSVPMVLIGRFLIELFGAGLPPAALAILSARGGAASRGRRMSLFTTSQAIGFLLGSVLGGFLSTAFAFRYAFLVITAVSSLAVVSAYFVPAGGGTARTSKTTWRSILRKTLPSFHAVRNDADTSAYGLINLYLGIILRKAGIVGIYGLLMVFLQQERSLTPLVSGSISASRKGSEAASAINPVFQALSMPLWGRAADRISRKRVFLIGHALSLLGPLMMLFSRSLWPLIGAFVILGVGFAALISGVTTFIGDVAPGDREGELMGLLKVSQGFGGIRHRKSKRSDIRYRKSKRSDIIGPAVAGIVSSPAVGGYNGMFVTMAAMMLSGLVITALGTRESHPASQARGEQSPARPS